MVKERRAGEEGWEVNVWERGGRISSPEKPLLAAAALVEILLRKLLLLLLLLSYGWAAAAVGVLSVKDGVGEGEFGDCDECNEAIFLLLTLCPQRAELAGN